MDLLVSTGWLADHLGAPDLRIVDASYFVFDKARDARADFEAGHIPGAVFLELENLKDTDNPIPFMLPSAATFAARMSALGIAAGDRIILYDDTPHRTAARAWWMLRAFGATRVALLDGGIAKWRTEGRPLETGHAMPALADFRAVFDPAWLRGRAEILDNIDSRAAQLLDARGAARFTGAETDPRPEVAAGHIPGSRNLPYDRLFNADGTWKRAATLAAEFDTAGIDLSRPLITTCGSGVTAAVILFGAALLGASDLALYDGSWSEWGTDPSTPKAVGAA